MKCEGYRRGAGKVAAGVRELSSEKMPLLHK